MNAAPAVPAAPAPSIRPGASAATGGGVPTAGANVLVDQDRGLPFPRDKQNEPAITRDPVTGWLVAGANDEIALPPCPGTTAPLGQPCPFPATAPISAFYRSPDGLTWNGGHLPGFDSIGRASGGDPTLDWGPRRCGDGVFRLSCGVASWTTSGSPSTTAPPARTTDASTCSGRTSATGAAATAG